MDRSGAVADAESEISVDGQGALEFWLRCITKSGDANKGEQGCSESWSVHGGILRQNFKVNENVLPASQRYEEFLTRVPRKLTPEIA
jgi:hypothetical protein